MINITPQGKQAEVFALPAKGHLVVLGTAGSGKTTIALLRAYHLANLDNNKVLLVTFNAALVQYMKDICGTVPDNLTIENYHKFARGYLNCRGKMPNRNGILSHNGKLSLIEQAIEICKNCYPNQSTLRRNKEFFYDEITFIEQFGFENEDEYYKAERIGRASANIKRENRHWIYLVFEQYKTLRLSNGFNYDWDDLAYYTYQELKKDDTPRVYNHIIVDEGQDFSPMMIKSLVRAVRENGSFTFMGDVAQQIYGSRLSWRDAEISTERIWKFQINYRNPGTISDFAYDITKSKFWIHTNDMIEPESKIAEGPKPILINFKSSDSELAWVVGKAIEVSEKSTTVIICRTRSDIDDYACALWKKGKDHTVIKKDTKIHIENGKIYLTTFHSAKGLEFAHVFIPRLTSEKLPDPDIINSATSTESALSDELKLLYVAVTRSKYGLYMTYSGTLSELFPSNSTNYIRHEKE